MNESVQTNKQHKKTTQKGIKMIWKEISDLKERKVTVCVK